MKMIKCDICGMVTETKNPLHAPQLILAPSKGESFNSQAFKHWDLCNECEKLLRKGYKITFEK